MSNLAHSTGIQPVDATMRVLVDPESRIEDRAAAYGLLHQVQLRMNRALKAAKDDLIVFLETSGQRELGPLSVASSSIDPEYVCNQPGNWQDSTTQEALEGLRADPDYSEYVRVIPAHLEIDTLRLGADVHAGVLAATQLFAQLKQQGWRREAGRRLSLRVREVKPKEKAA